MPSRKRRSHDKHHRSGPPKKRARNSPLPFDEEEGEIRSSPDTSSSRGYHSRSSSHKQSPRKYDDYERERDRERSRDRRSYRSRRSRSRDRSRTRGEAHRRHDRDSKVSHSPSRRNERSSRRYQDRNDRRPRGTRHRFPRDSRIEYDDTRPKRPEWESTNMGRNPSKDKRKTEEDRAREEEEYQAALAAEEAAEKAKLEAEEKAREQRKLRLARLKEAKRQRAQQESAAEAANVSISPPGPSVPTVSAGPSDGDDKPNEDTSMKGVTSESDHTSPPTSVCSAGDSNAKNGSLSKKELGAQEEIVCTSTTRLTDAKCPSPPTVQAQQNPPEEVYDMFSMDALANSKPKLDLSSRRRGFNVADDGATDSTQYRPAGELLDEKYIPISMAGSGSFSVCYRAHTMDTRKEFVLKIIHKNNDAYTDSGRQEISILRKLNPMIPTEEKRPENHCLRLLDEFSHNGHLCLVFEPFESDLRKVVTKKGHPLRRISRWGKQLMVALRHLKVNKIVHTDIKPENILITKDRMRLMLCDFGTAKEISEIIPTPIHGSRWYRSPELMIGCKYDYALDMWAVGCVIYELWTGHQAFKGDDNHGQLEQIFTKLQTSIPFKHARTGTEYDKHFAHKNAELLVKLNDPVNQDVLGRMTLDVSPTTKERMKQVLSGGISEERMAETDVFDKFVDLMMGVWNTDPSKRITAEKAVDHDFFNL